MWRGFWYTIHIGGLGGKNSRDSAGGAYANSLESERLHARVAGALAESERPVGYV